MSTVTKPTAWHWMKYIQDEVSEILEAAESGGHWQYAFELTADENELRSIHERLANFNAEIHAEVATNA